MIRLIARELDALGVRYEYLHRRVLSEARKNLDDDFEELVKSLDREKELLKEMFANRIRYLRTYGVIRDTGNFLEWKNCHKRNYHPLHE